MKIASIPVPSSGVTAVGGVGGVTIGASAGFGIRPANAGAPGIGAVPGGHGGMVGEVVMPAGTASVMMHGSVAGAVGPVGAVGLIGAVMPPGILIPVERSVPPGLVQPM